MIEPMRMHPVKMILSFLSLLKSYFIIVLFLYVIHLQDTAIYIKVLQVFFVVFFISQIIKIVLEWFQTKYAVEDGVLYMRSGHFRKKHQSIPLHEVQSITWETPFYYQKLNLTSLLLRTSASGETATIKLEAMKVDKAKQLAELATTYMQDKQEDRGIEEEESFKEETVEKEREEEEKTSASGETATIKLEAMKVDKAKQLAELATTYMQDEQEDRKLEEEIVVHFTPSRRDLIKASFFSFSFLGLIPLLVASYQKLNVIFNLNERLNERAANVVSLITSSWLLMGTLCLILIFATMTFGLMRTYLYYGKYEISSSQERIYIRSGVLNEKTFSIRKDAVQALRLKQSPIKKIFNQTEIKLVSGDHEEDDSDTTYSLYPYLPTEQANSLLENLLPQFRMESKMKQLPKCALYMRMIRIPWAFFIGTSLLFWFKKEWLFLSLFLLVATYVVRYLQYKNTRFSWEETMVQWKTGGLWSETFVTNRKKIIEMEVEQSYFQRKFGLATVNIINRTKSVNLEELRDIPHDEARHCVEWYQNRGNDVKYITSR